MNIAEVIAHVVACTGWTWDYVSEHVDLPRLAALNEQWDRYPPLHVMVAAYLGVKTGPKPEVPAEQDFSAFLNQTI